MAILVDRFIDILERLAPAGLAEEWDNIGLQAGGRGDAVSAVLVSLNVTDEVIDEAAGRGCQLILTHHPLIFRPISSASQDTLTGRLIGKAAREGIAVLAAHTNLDAARNGLADIMAGLFGLVNVEPLRRAPAGWSKLVTFIPESDLPAVRAALFGAGGGVIGDYRHCSFTVAGTGTFLPEEGAQPVIGKVGRDEQVAELRLEMVFPSGRRADMISALVAASSYEEPAYDVYPLVTPRHDAGSGRIGDLAGEMTLQDFTGMAATLFGCPRLSYAGDADRPVNRVALVPGGGSDHLGDAAAAGADTYVSGDFRYHQGLEARELDLALVDVPHDRSEQVALEHWLGRLESALAGQGVAVHLSGASTGFWQSAAQREVSRNRETSAATAGEDSPNGLYQLHVDGGSRGNPGPAGIGAVLSGPDGREVDSLGNFIGTATNNIAEYQALISGVEMALDHDITRLAIFSDSELIVRQLQGRYKVKNEGLRPYYRQARDVLGRLEQYELINVPREANAAADALVNRALDDAGK